MGLNKDDLKQIVETIVMAVVAILFVFVVLRPLVSRFSPQAQSEQTYDDDDGLQMLTAGGGGQRALEGPDGMSGGAQAKRIEGGGENVDSGNEEMVDLAAVDGKIKASTLQKVSEIVEEKPAETVSVIRNWMFQES